MNAFETFNKVEGLYIR